MRKHFIISLTILTFSIFLGGCSNSNHLIKDENKLLKSKISQLEKELASKNDKISELQNEELRQQLTINYIETTTSKVVIEKATDLLAFPIDNAIKLNSIPENTVVNVLDTANVSNSIWLYVSIPVYDSPSNYKGWLKEISTVPYTKDKMNIVQGDVKVKKGEDTYETDSFEGIKSVKPNKALGDEHGRITLKKGGYVRLECSGGKTIWVKQTAIVFPEIDL